MKQLYTVPKVISEPLIPVKGSWIDAFPLVLIFVLFLSALWLVSHPHRKNQVFRFLIRSISFFVFVFFLFKCLCVAKLAIFGLSGIGRDDLLSFGQLWLFAMVGGFTFIGGRIFCGWICPLGFLQETIAAISPRMGKTGRLTWLVLVLASAVFFLLWTMPANEFAVEYVIAIFASVTVLILIIAQIRPEWDRFLLKIKFPLLILYVFICAFAVYFSETWCPLYGAEVDYSALTALALVTLASAAVSMPWCRYMCPTGLFLALLSRESLFRIRGACRGCGEDCSRICPTGALKNGRVDELLCISCTKCAVNCGSDFGSAEPENSSDGSANDQK